MEWFPISGGDLSFVYLLSLSLSLSLSLALTLESLALTLESPASLNHSLTQSL